MTDAPEADVEDLPTHATVPVQSSTAQPSASASALPELSSTATGAGKEKKKKKVKVFGNFKTLK